MTNKPLNRAWLLLLPIAGLLLQSGCGEPASAPKNNANNAPVGVQKAPAGETAAAIALADASAKSADAKSEAPDMPPAISRVPKALKCRPVEDRPWLEGLEGQSPTQVKEALVQNNSWEQYRGDFYEWWGQQDPVAAMKDAADTNPGASTLATGSVLAGWLRKDGREPLQWLATRPENAETTLQAMHIVREVEPAELADLASWADGFSTFPSGVILKSTLADIWRGADAAAASQWVLAQETTELKPSDFLRKFVSNWTTADPLQFSQFLQTMPAGLAKDKAVSIFATAISGEDKDAALVWAKSIATEELQKEVMSHLSPPSPAKEAESLSQ